MASSSSANGRRATPSVRPVPTVPSPGWLLRGAATTGITSTNHHTCICLRGAQCCLHWNHNPCRHFTDENPLREPQHRHKRGRKPCTRGVEGGGYRYLYLLIYPGSMRRGGLAGWVPGFVRRRSIQEGEDGVSLLLSHTNTIQ